MSTVRDSFSEDQFNAICGLFEVTREGMAKYTGPIRIALLIQRTNDGKLWVFDPDSLLKSHYREIKEFIGSESWNDSSGMEYWKPEDIHELHPLDVSAISKSLIVAGTKSLSCYRQLWILEKLPTTCSAKVLFEWAMDAARLLAEQMSDPNLWNMQTTAMTALKGNALVAIDSFLQSVLNKRERAAQATLTHELVILSALEAILEISKTLEEGQRPSGKLVLINRTNIVSPPPKNEAINFIAKFPLADPPKISRAKHVRKLLTAIANTEHFIVADTEKVLGIGKPPIPSQGIVATFNEGKGSVFLGTEHVCNFADGRFSGAKANVDMSSLIAEPLVQALEDKGELLQEIVVSIIKEAQNSGHGCTLVLDFTSPASKLSGQYLEPALNLKSQDELRIGFSMSGIDGALHIYKNGKLLAFGCLLDGLSVPELENRERGSRYNSAVRFTHTHSDTIVLTVSEDGPVSIFSNGKLINPPKKLSPINQGHMNTALSFDDWISQFGK